MHTAKEIYAWPAQVAAVSNFDCMTLAIFPCGIGQCDKLGERLIPKGLLKKGLSC
jgi:hypothetical protein